MGPNWVECQSIRPVAADSALTLQPLTKRLEPETVTAASPQVSTKVRQTTAPVAADTR